MTVFQSKQSNDLTADGDMAATSVVSQLRQLQRQYELAGLNLYPLDGDSLLVVHQHYGMSRALNGMREASLYLRQIGGAQCGDDGGVHDGDALEPESRTRHQRVKPL